MTVTAMPATQQAIRLRRPPLLEPYDDEQGRAGTPGALLPIDWSPSAPAVPRHRAASAGPRPHQDPSSQAAATAQRYIQICLEVLNGFRPPAHLRTLTGPVEFTAVVGQLARRRNAHAHFPALGHATPATAPTHPNAAPTACRTLPTAPGRNTPRYATAPARPATPGTATPSTATPGTATPGTATPGTATPSTPAAATPGTPAHSVSARRQPANAARDAQPYRLQRLRVAEPLPGVAEVVAVLSHAGASMAIAMRLEFRDTRWQCAVVQII